MRKPHLGDSFLHALRGLQFVFRHERNFRVECFFSIVVFLSFFIFHFSRIEMIVLILLCGSVLILEIVNTVVEHFLDLIKPRFSYQIKVIKDVLSGMVLVSVLMAIVVGCIIYIPAFIELTHSFVIQ